jgi:predicted HAD superfamily Cof-like phosphohydrolase
MRLFALDGVVKSDRSRLRVVSENLTRGGTMAKKVAAKKATAKESAKQLSAKQVSKAAQVLATARTGLVLTGRIKDGKVVFDQTTLDEVAKKFPKGDVAFIAMNAPFDPKAEPALV